MTIRGTWYMITDMDGCPQFVEDADFASEFKSEKAALKAAKEKLGNSCESEVWVWKLSHVVSSPDVEPTIDVVK